MWQRDMLEGESWRESRGDLWWIRRKGRRDHDVLAGLEPVIEPGELLVGKQSRREPTPEEAARLEAARAFMGTQPIATGQAGHMAIDYATLVARGCRGLQEDIRARQAGLTMSCPEEQQQWMFYDAAWAALEGACELSVAYAAQARELAATEADPARRAELEEIARICDRVPAQPAETVREALQSAHFVTFCISMADNHWLMCPGRIDRWLWPLYQADLAAGRTTPERTQELIDCLYILMNEIIPRGLAVGVMVGGQDGDCNDVTNDLSTLCLEAVENTRLAYPTLGICWHEGTPDALLDLGCRLMALGRANPAVFNDQVIPEGLRRAGVRPSEAHQYINSTCVEISPVGSSNVWVASPYFNLTQCLLDTVNDHVARGETPAFEALKASFKQRLAGQIADAVADQNSARESRERFGGAPLLSCFVNDCLERGRDMDHGGARHNWIECSFVGLANLVDALCVVREFVYERQTLGLPGLKEVLDADYAGAEDTRQRFLNYPVKYGNDNDEADSLAAEMTEFLSAETARHHVRLNDRYYAGFFCWIMHQQLGSATGASADGRKAGVAFADGAGPAQGRERNGPTAAVKSTTRWDHTPMLGGLVLNLKFGPRALQQESSRAKLMELLKTYLRLGGQEVQVNCVGRETLEAAREHPEQYRDLLVRVAGYVDYFVGLPPGMQDEVIMRTEFDVV
jgi:formate C-acetyltransferase